MTKLHISDELSLPLDFVTQTQAILAKKRVGKSYTASVQAEELLKAGQQIAVIDPTGAWWGLKSSADGKHAGFSIAVFGGEHADVPLEDTAGETIAQAIVEQRFSAILDLSLLRKGQVNRFMAPFLETLYRLNRQAMHLFVDEADAIAPQKPFGEEARMLGAMEDVVRRGGIRGIGTTLITQRPAVLNKNVLTQCEILCALRIVHHKDIDAIHEWIEVHGDPAIAKRMIDSLPALPIGTAWFWSPGWGDIFQQVKIRRRETFDSGATPKAGEVKPTAKVLAQVDLEKLGAQIKSTVQRAQENDPKNLRKKIAELEREVARKQAPAGKLVPVVDEKAIERAVKAATAPLLKKLSDLRRAATPVSNALDSLRRTFDEPLAPAPSFTPAPAPTQRVQPPTVRAATPANGHSTSELPKGEQIILRAIAQYPEGAQRDQLTVLTGYKRSTRDAYIQRLREKEFVVENGSAVLATVAGIAALGSSYEPLPTGEALQEYWLNRLPEGERKIFAALLRTPAGLSRESLEEATGYKRSTRDAYIQRLQSRRLVEIVGRGEVKPSENLFA